MSASGRWREMLDEFRALGGTAENVRLGHGHFGRGLFPIDPAKPVVISIPEDLLVAVDDVVFDNNVFCVSSSSPVSVRGRAFVEQYQREFSWGAEGRAEIERFLEIMQTAPDELRELLVNKYHLSKFYRPNTPDIIQTLFVNSRSIQSGGRRVIMPIVEIANHGSLAGYETDRGVSLRGKFSGEVLVRYCRTADPYSMFLNWMFAPEQEDMGFSIGMILNAEGRKFRIDRRFEDEGPPWVPRISVEDTQIVASYVLLGHRQFPRVPKGAFHRAISEAAAGLSDETYDLIQHANRQHFLDLMGDAERAGSPAAPLLRSLARCQLGALSSHYGIRQV